MLGTFGSNFNFTFEVWPIHGWQLILDKFRQILNQVLIILKLKGEESIKHQQIFFIKENFINNLNQRNHLTIN